MYIGVDLGTSAVKVLLVDENQDVVDQQSAALDVQRPHSLWSEQDPHDWWRAADEAIGTLADRRRGEMAAVIGVGLSGQMHGATLLDRQGEPLRPAILWNDGRSARQCAELERREPRSRDITGNLAMPGFTAPKLLWVEENEPEVFRKVAKVLLPKDYLRWRLTGDYASEMSDAAGTLWLDVARRQWSDQMLEACHLQPTTMPALFEGNAATGTMSAPLATRWGMSASVKVAGGGGDNAAGAVGIGVIAPGQAFLSLGTSGVLFVVNEKFAPNPERAVHAFCHALPGRWHQMSVILSAASCLSWARQALGAASENELLDEAAQATESSRLLFLPYLSGERTPHNDPHAKGAFIGVTHETTRGQLARAVLEGVAFAFAEGRDVLTECGTPIGEVSVIGGGARSSLWGKILATALEQPLTYHVGGEYGAAFGAARLGRMAATGEPAEEICRKPAVHEIVEPDKDLVERYREGRALYARCYAALRPLFPSL